MSKEQPSATFTFRTEGYNDHLSGYGITECPYDLGSDRHAQWFDGWKEADAERIADEILDIPKVREAV